MKKILPILLPVVLATAAGLYSVFLEQDINYDMLSYHLYNPFALLNGHLGVDIIPAGMHSFYNSFPDLYFYFIFQTFMDFPHWVAFFMGVPYGLLIWVVYLFAKDLFQGEDTPKIMAFWATFLGCAGAGMLSQVGTTTNDIPLAIGSIGSLWLVIRFSKNPARTGLAYWAAFIGGAVMGLKLTTTPFCAAMTVIAFFSLPKVKNKLSFVVLFGLSGLLGFLLADGYFLWKWWSLYQNPIFPFYNDIFKSPFFDNFYLTDSRFLPKTWLHYLFYPLYWAFSPSEYAAEMPVRDLRFTLLLLSAIYGLKKFFPYATRGAKQAEPFFLLAVYALVAYVLWLTKFSLLRYGIVLEIVCGLLVVKACKVLFKKKYWLVGFLSIFAVTQVFTVSADYGHNPFYKKAIVFTNKPQIEDDSLVLLLVQPLAYLAPFLNPKATYMSGFKYNPANFPLEVQENVRLFKNLPDDFYRFHFEDKQKEVIKKHQGPIYAIVPMVPGLLLHPNLLAPYGLKGDSKTCKSFTTNLTLYTPSMLLICPVEKI
ncbi:hypothetical protein [Candidatus Avelusimicrobium sp.]|uniref:hypothetical protein n=1 Tax=Candidatus Avelusimicrobium sp. TaxID=3048833 RepID=UPI003D7ECFD5